jgi:hypothetical protein
MAKKSTKKAIPKAFVDNAAKLGAKKRAEIIARGRDDVALVKEKIVVVTDAFYDIGLALQRLAVPGVATALGFKGFGDLVTKALKMSPSSAGDLIEIVTWVSRRDALVWRREKSAALVELAKATPATDTPATLMKRPVKLASGRLFDAREADAGAVHAAAKEERQARTERESSHGKAKRGVSSTKAERDCGAALQAGLHKEGLRGARVTVLARPSTGAVLKIENVPVAKLAALAKAARAVHLAR